MEHLHNGCTLDFSPGAFPLSTDSVALARFARLPKNARVLDLGAGCGTLGVFLCDAHPDCFVTGVELDEQAHRMAQKNAADNGLTDRLASICADLRTIPSFLTAGSFSCCISNPPYFSGGPASQSAPIARGDSHCTMDDLMKNAAWALKYGGDFFLVHRPERLAELFSCACRYNLEPKRLQLLRHRSDGPVTLVLVACRKGARPGLNWEEAILYDANGQPTPYYRELYHL